MASQVEICNKALVYLGVKSIASLAENSNPALRLSAVYATARDATLRSHAWGFATMVETLAQISAETIPGWKYLYMVPPLCIRIDLVFDNTQTTNPDPIEYMEVRSPTSGQRAIACNSSPAYIRYVYLVDDTTLYSADFVEAFALKLGAETAYVLTGNTELGPRLQAAFGAAVSEAKRISASGKNLNPSADNSESSYESARA